MSLAFLVRALVSGLIVATIALVARRNAAAGALIASLPLISLLGIVWLWHDTHDRARLADHVEATFYYVLPSLPMFLLVPALLRGGMNVWLALLLGCALTALLYALTVAVVARFGIRL